MNHFEHEDVLVYDEPAADLDAIDLSTFSGEVELSGSDAETVHIVATRRVRATDEEIGRACVEAITSVIEREGKTLVVRTPKPEMPMLPYIRHATVDYQVTLPARFAARAKSYNGAIRVEGVERDVSAVSYNGEIRVADVGGRADALTYNGEIVLDRVGSAAKAESYNGAIRADVQRLTEETVFKTMNGAISVALHDVVGAPLKASSLNGAINLRVPPDAAFSLRAHTGVGAIHTDWGSARGRWGLMAAYEKAVNGGGTPVELHTLNGGIQVGRNL